MDRPFRVRCLAWPELLPSIPAPSIRTQQEIEARSPARPHACHPLLISYCYRQSISQTRCDQGYQGRVLSRLLTTRLSTRFERAATSPPTLHFNTTSSGRIHYSPPASLPTQSSLCRPSLPPNRPVERTKRAPRAAAVHASALDLVERVGRDWGRPGLRRSARRDTSLELLR